MGICSFCVPASTAQLQDPALPQTIVEADSALGRIGDWFVLSDLEGERVEPEEVLGSVLFINFWATWCAPCLEEMPSIEALSRSVADSGVRFLMISVDDRERDVRRFLRRRALDLPLFLRGWLPGESTFRAGIIPATFIVDRSGRIVFAHHGAANWDNQEVRDFLNKLSKETS